MDLNDLIKIGKRTRQLPKREESWILKFRKRTGTCMIKIACYRFHCALRCYSPYYYLRKYFIKITEKMYMVARNHCEEIVECTTWNILNLVILGFIFSLHAFLNFFYYIVRILKTIRKDKKNNMRSLKSSIIESVTIEIQL